MEIEKATVRPPGLSVGALLQFVNEELLAGAEPTVAIDTPLFADGRIDSLKLLRLITFVEEQSNRSIPDELIEKDRFHTIAAIAENFLVS
jgi:acyl carrier protein